MQQKSFTNKFYIILSFATIYLIWGSSFLAILISLEDFSPLILTSFRFAIAGIILMGYSIVARLKMPSNENLLKNVIIGIIVLLFGQGLLVWAEQYISSGNAAIIVSSSPIWFVLLDKTKRKPNLSNKYIISGVVIGFFGMLLLFYHQLDIKGLKSSVLMTLIASIAVIITVICWIAGTLYHRSNIKSGGIITNLSWQLLTAGIVGILISLFFNEFSNFSLVEVSFNSWLALFYLAIGSSIVAYVAYTWLLTQKSSVIVGTYAYICPIIAIILGNLFANEIISKLQLFAMCIIIFSAVLINTNKTKTHTN